MRMLVMLALAAGVMASTAHAKIERMQHQSQDDYALAWSMQPFSPRPAGTEAVIGLQSAFHLPFLDLALARQAGDTLLLKKPRSQAEFRLWGTMPDAEPLGRPLFAHGRMWFLAQTDGGAFLYSSPLQTQTPEWQAKPIELAGSLHRFRLNADGDPVLETQSPGQPLLRQVGRFQGGGSAITWQPPAEVPQAMQSPNPAAPRAHRWTSEFDLGGSQRLLSLSWQPKGAPIDAIRYRVSQDDGQGYGVWSPWKQDRAFVLNRPGRYLQYELRSQHEPSAQTGLPTVEVTFYRTPPEDQFPEHETVDGGWNRPGSNLNIDPQPNAPPLEDNELQDLGSLDDQAASSLQDASQPSQSSPGAGNGPAGASTPNASGNGDQSNPPSLQNSAQSSGADASPPPSNQNDSPQESAPQSQSAQDNASPAPNGNQSAPDDSTNSSQPKPKPKDGAQDDDPGKQSDQDTPDDQSGDNGAPSQASTSAPEPSQPTSQKPSAQKPQSNNSAPGQSPSAPNNADAGQSAPSQSSASAPSQSAPNTNAPSPNENPNPAPPQSPGQPSQSSPAPESGAGQGKSPAQGNGAPPQSKASSPQPAASAPNGGDPNSQPHQPHAANSAPGQSGSSSNRSANQAAALARFSSPPNPINSRLASLQSLSDDAPAPEESNSSAPNETASRAAPKAPPTSAPRGVPVRPQNGGANTALSSRVHDATEWIAAGPAQPRSSRNWTKSAAPWTVSLIFFLLLGWRRKKRQEENQENPGLPLEQTGNPWIAHSQSGEGHWQEEIWFDEQVAALAWSESSKAILLQSGDLWIGPQGSWQADEDARHPWRYAGTLPTPLDQPRMALSKKGILVAGSNNGRFQGAWLPLQKGRSQAQRLALPRDLQSLQGLEAAQGRFWLWGNNKGAGVAASIGENVVKEKRWQRATTLPNDEILTGFSAGSPPVAAGQKHPDSETVTLYRLHEDEWRAIGKLPHQDGRLIMSTQDASGLMIEDQGRNQFAVQLFSCKSDGRMKGRYPFALPRHAIEELQAARVTGNRLGMLFREHAETGSRWVWRETQLRTLIESTSQPTAA